MSASDNKTVRKQPNPVPNSKPFIKGDPRINRNGRPRTFDAARKIFQEVAHAEITDKHGDKLLMIEAIARSWATSKEPALQKAFVEWCFGKVPDRLETEGMVREHIFVTFTKAGERSSIVSHNESPNGRS